LHSSFIPYSSLAGRYIRGRLDRGGREGRWKSVIWGSQAEGAGATEERALRIAETGIGRSYRDLKMERALADLKSI